MTPNEAGAPLAEEPVHPRPPSPSPPPKSSSGTSELVLRILTASVLIPSIIYAIVQGGLWTLGTVIVLILIGMREFYQVLEAKGAHPLTGFGLASGAALPVVAYFGTEYQATILMTFVLLAVMVGQVGKAQISEALASISGTFFGIFYVGWLLTHAVTLRNFHDVAASKWGAAAAAQYVPDSGIFLLLFPVVVVVSCDAGAYFAGRAWGRRTLSKISPGKTVEGALGGVAAGTVGGLVCKGLFDLQWPELSSGLPWSIAAGLAVVLSVTGIVGDLVESLLKRDAEIKDAGSILPGMGGILDRIDSALLAIPVMYYLLLAYTFLTTSFR